MAEPHPVSQLDRFFSPVTTATLRNAQIGERDPDTRRPRAIESNATSFANAFCSATDLFGNSTARHIDDAAKTGTDTTWLAFDERCTRHLTSDIVSTPTGKDPSGKGLSFEESESLCHKRTLSRITQDMNTQSGVTRDMVFESFNKELKSSFSNTPPDVRMFIDKIINFAGCLNDNLSVSERTIVAHDKRGMQIELGHEKKSFELTRKLKRKTHDIDVLHHAASEGNSIINQFHALSTARMVDTEAKLAKSRKTTEDDREVIAMLAHITEETSCAICYDIVGVGPHSFYRTTCGKLICESCDNKWTTGCPWNTCVQRYVDNTIRVNEDGVSEPVRCGRLYTIDAADQLHDINEARQAIKDKFPVVFNNIKSVPSLLTDIVKKQHCFKMEEMAKGEDDMSPPDIDDSTDDGDM